jgi:hypothetical protein
VALTSGVHKSARKGCGTSSSYTEGGERRQSAGLCSLAGPAATLGPIEKALSCPNITEVLDGLLVIRRAALQARHDYTCMLPLRTMMVLTFGCTWVTEMLQLARLACSGAQAEGSGKLASR